MTTRIALRLDPLDTLFFRDGRPFGASTRAEGGLPLPRSLAGALRSRLVSQYANLGSLPERRRQGVPIEQALRDLGCPEWVLRTRVHGPWLAQGPGSRATPLVPTPIILGRDKDSLFRLKPLAPKQIPGWSDANGLWPLWRAGGAEAKPAGGFLKPRGLQAFLAGDIPDKIDIVQSEDLFGHDDRTGLAIGTDTLTGIDSMLYGIRLLVLQKGVCFYAEVLPGPDAPADATRLLEGAIPLGGEGRYVRATATEPFAWPEAPPAERSLWLLISPAPLRQAHRPDTLPPGVVVRAAATAAPFAFSGWDVARNGPERTRFAVPAGAVYFVEGEFAPAHHSFCTAEDAAAGWGLALRGTWK